MVNHGCIHDICGWLNSWHIKVKWFKFDSLVDIGSYGAKPMGQC
jgi:hypothetical protein